MSRGEILVVDDEPDIRRLVQEILEDEDYQTVTADNAAHAREALRAHQPDVILLDIWMPDEDGISLLKEWHEQGTLNAPVIIMSGHGNIETAVEATRLGAYDFIEKPVSMGKLLLIVDRALQASQKLKTAAATTGPVGALVGNSAIMSELRKQVDQAAASEAWVMINGETGTGKSAIARYIHNHSTRSTGPFVEVSLASIPSQNILGQLFGTELSQSGVAGSLEQAQGGTLLLNEIGELDPENQSMLAQAFREKRFQRFGGNDDIEMDVRVITTNAHGIRDAVTAGRFRQDLFELLNVAALNIPSLREHVEDMPELVNAYAEWFADREGMPYRKFTTGALNNLRNYAWPDNARELRGLIKKLLIMNQGPEVTIQELREALLDNVTPAAAGDGLDTSLLLDMPLRDARDGFEKVYLEHQLRKANGNVSDAANAAGIERTHLYRKLKQLGINPKSLKPH
ncbi:MAG: sigma-54-dependent Fis family transcriptional regulator [Proteobacteria bacterium]|nr:sigma-54-dependent Fis family transcriptional regulator [Pseudomonadota bacterium]